MSHDSTSWSSTEDSELADGLSADAVFDVLAHEYRRSALSYLARSDGPVPVDDLVTAVAAKVDGSEDPENTQKRIATIFYHSHLPKMADAGVIDYNREQNTVAVTSEADQIQSVLSTF